MDDADAVLTEEPCQNSPPEGETPAEHATGRRWGFPHGRSEPRPRQADNRIADEVLAILAQAALENEQIDKEVIPRLIMHAAVMVSLFKIGSDGRTIYTISSRTG